MAFGDRAGQPPRVPDGRGARCQAVKRVRQVESDELASSKTLESIVALAIRGPRDVICPSLRPPDQAWPAAAYLRALQRHSGNGRRLVGKQTTQYAVAAPPNKHRYCTRS